MAKAWSADGKGFAICQQMANSLSETLPVKASLPSAGWWQRACGFAICWQMAKPLNGVSPVRRLTAYFAICQQMAKAAGSLPSASRWQRLHALPSASRWQSDYIAPFNFVFSYINSFSQKIKHKYIYMTNIAYSTHITNSHEHIYIQHMLPIVASFIRTYT